MCLVTRKKAPTKSRKEIKVWKILKVRTDESGSKKYYSPIIGSRYERGETYEVSMFTYNPPDVSWTAYSYVQLNHLNRYYNGWAESSSNKIKLNLISVAEGFHAYTSKDDANKRMLEESSNFKVFEFVIPKGSYYIKGVNGEIVSTKIKML